MKKLIPLILSNCIVLATFAQSLPTTQAFINTDGNEDVYILSAANICFGSLSSKRDEQAITYTAGVPNNVYADLNKCEAAGGTLSEDEKQLKLVMQVLTAENQEKEKEQEEQDNNKFFGINFGLGLAFTGMREPIVSDISIEKLTETDDAQSVIHVNHQTRNRAIAMLESHYFFEKSLISDAPSSNWGHGPFIAIGLVGEDGVDPLSTYGGGWMWGFKRENGSSFNIGLGIYVDTKATLLRPEYSDGLETDISNEELLTYDRDKKGWMLMFSSSF